MLKKDTAICIRAIDYSETSQIVTLFTKEHGKIDAMAKGSKRPKSPFGGTIEIFSCGEIVFSEKAGQKLATLAEFNQQPQFWGLRSNLYALNCALFAAELVESFTIEYDPHPELFEETTQFLQKLLDGKSQQELLAELVNFQFAILRLIGGGLVLDHCTNCKTVYNTRWPAVYFSSSSHGLVCRDCEASFQDKMRLDGEPATFFCGLRPMQDADEDSLRQSEKILIYHFTQLLHRPPKMARYFTSSSTG